MQRTRHRSVAPYARTLRNSAPRNRTAISRKVCKEQIRKSVPRSPNAPPKRSFSSPWCAAKPYPGREKQTRPSEDVPRHPGHSGRTPGGPTPASRRVSLAATCATPASVKGPVNLQATLRVACLVATENGSAASGAGRRHPVAVVWGAFRSGSLPLRGRIRGAFIARRPARARTPPEAVLHKTNRG